MYQLNKKIVLMLQQISQTYDIGRYVTLYVHIPVSIH